MVLELMEWGRESGGGFKSGQYRREDDLLLQSSTALKKPQDLTKQITDMIDTMYAAHGIGLAGVQVGFLKRLFVLDIPDYSNGPQVFINPEIIEFSRDLTEHEEGCLSIPEIRVRIKRPRTVRVRYLDRNLKVQEEVFSELYAVCIQHEIDHLDGILFLQRISKRSVKKVVKNLVEEGYSEAVYGDYPFGEKSYRA